MCLAGAGPAPVHRFGPPLKPPPLLSGPGPYVVLRSVIFTAIDGNLNDLGKYFEQLKKGIR